MDIEAKALELVNKDAAKGYECQTLESATAGVLRIRLLEAIEAHEADKARHAAEMEAFRREVSEAVVFALKVYGGHRTALVLLHRFIIPQADPLVEAWNDAFGHGAGLLMVGQLKAALADRGLEIVKKEPNE